MIRVKRIYEEPSADDGQRILVDRLWPRGLSKEVARVDAWLKDVAPSHELRKWYGHDAEKWPEFKRRYAVELQDREELLQSIGQQARKGTVTLLYSSREPRYNNAAALKEFIEKGL